MIRRVRLYKQAEITKREGKQNGARSVTNQNIWKKISNYNDRKMWFHEFTIVGTRMDITTYKGRKMWFHKPIYRAESGSKQGPAIRHLFQSFITQRKDLTSQQL